jgi:hypothetical protein
MDRPALLRLLCADETCSAECLRRRTFSIQLCFLLSTLTLDMKHDATDRFMRDAICGCYYTERLLLLHHLLYYSRPKFSGDTVFWLFGSWSSVFDKRKVASLNEFIFRQKVLHLEVQFPSRG